MDNMIANNSYHLQLTNIRPSTTKEQEKEDHQLLNLAWLRISYEIDQQKADKCEINQKLRRFSYLDELIERKMQEIKSLDSWGLGKTESSLPIKSVPRTTGFLHLLENDARSTPIRPNKKRCQKSLIKKGRIDIEYLQLVQEELLSSKKSYGMGLSGKQELNNLIKSMMQRIEHGNKKRDDEIKIYHAIRNMKKTRELYMSPEPDPHTHNWYLREQKSKEVIDWERSVQHKIHIRLDDIEIMKREQSGRQARVRGLKAELEHVRKKIKLLNRELENANAKQLEAYKRAYESAEQKEEFVL